LKIILVISILTLNVFANCVFFISQEFEYKGKKYKPCEDYQVFFDHSSKLKNGEWILSIPGFNSLEFKKNEIYYNSFKKRDIINSQVGVILDHTKAIKAEISIKERHGVVPKDYYNNIFEGKVKKSIEKLKINNEVEGVNRLQDKLKPFTYFFTSSSIKTKESRLHLVILDEKLPAPDQLKIYYLNGFTNAELTSDKSIKDNFVKNISLNTVKLDKNRFCISFDGFNEFTKNNFTDFVSASELIIEDKNNDLLYFFDTVPGGDDYHTIDLILRTLIVDRKKGFALYKNICSME
jgi:hypothetical protein